MRRANVVHLNSLYYRPSFVLALVGLLLGKRIIWSVRGELSDAACSSALKKSYIKVIRLLFGQRVTFHATSLLELCDVKSKLTPKTDVILLPNYMILPAECDDANSYHGDLLYLGRLVPIKSLDKLIRALALSKEFLTSTRKIIFAGVGEPAYVRFLKQLAEELAVCHKIEFVGLIEGEDKERLYAGSFCSLLVSESENSGNVVIESLAQGTPAITSLGTPWQVLEEKRIGRHVKNDPEQIAQAIGGLMAISEDQYYLMRCRCKRFCRQEYDIASNVDRWTYEYSKS